MSNPTNNQNKGPSDNQSFTGLFQGEAGNGLLVNRQKTTHFWELKTRHMNGVEVKRRFRADVIMAGSSPKADLKIPQPAPEHLFSLTREITDTGEVFFHLEVFDESHLQIKRHKAWEAAQSQRLKEIPQFKFFEETFELSDLTDERHNGPRFVPEEWAMKHKRYEKDCHALWHLKNDVLIESILVEKGHTPYQLKCGYSVKWDEQNPWVLQLIEYDGIAQNVEMKMGRLKSYRGTFQDSVFVVTPVPELSSFKALPLSEPVVPESNLFRKTLLGVGFTWLLLLTLLQVMPRSETVADIPLENLSPDLAKIILEAPKKDDGGNGQRGGGGVEYTKNNDKRGGSGFESQKIAESAGPDEVQVRDKGALAALTKAEKVLGTGVLKALEIGGAMSNALSALDEGVKSGKVKMAGIPGTGLASNGKGSANGVLGALGKIGAGGPSGGGVGIGGVGTHGLGGGGGGGKGGGFGTGVGAGLGGGDGNRSIPFESDNLIVKGGLERSEVEAVIQENLSQIRFCYNRGLRLNPSLQGKVTSAFVISGDGSVKVSRVANSTLAATEVEGCIKDRVASWKFPQPRGGGEVAVNYPFLLKAN